MHKCTNCGASWCSKRWSWVSVIGYKDAKTLLNALIPLHGTGIIRKKLEARLRERVK